MKKVAVIGSGIFGCTAALELSEDFDVTIFDRAGGILEGASTINHLRHHLGFHYPRSKETAPSADVLITNIICFLCSSITYSLKDSDSCINLA